MHHIYSSRLLFLRNICCIENWQVNIDIDYFQILHIVIDYFQNLLIDIDINGYINMTKIQINPSNELQCVTANLTLHMMSKIEFQPDFRNPQMLSFPNMYNTMGSKMDGLAVREHFLSKNAEKTAFLAARFSDHLTSERSSTHNFKD